MKLFITDYREDLKCGGCNWRTSTFYGLGETLKKAKADFEKDENYGRGLCANCIAEHISNQEFDITQPKVKV